MPSKNKFNPCDISCAFPVPGTQGPTGPTGEQGVPGTQGPTGPTGEQGVPGTQGSTGPTGEQGVPGTQGSTGPTGEQGVPGIQGSTGPTGPVPQSAFRAVNGSPQTIGTNFTLVGFDTEEFDLNNEYIPGNVSLFIPKQDGVYLIEASIGVTVETTEPTFTIAIVIFLNSSPIQVKNNFINSNAINIVAVSSILQLQAGDTVQIFAASGEIGTISEEISVTNFAAARFPSPDGSPLFSPFFRKPISISDLSQKILGI
ncbi:hypothetical protein [Bacillus cereus group sp. RP43]|uniref:hypothetical protein n=1 Tax=Bacillus cereus group sp. RP43 TaxID=3040260 RepID=UPI003399A908